MADPAWRGAAARGLRVTRPRVGGRRVSGGWGAGRVSGRVPVCPAGDRPFTSACYLVVGAAYSPRLLVTGCRMLPPPLLLEVPVPLVLDPVAPAEPLPASVLRAETGALTELGRVTEISDPLVLPALVLVPPAAEPLPVSLLAAETG